MLDYYLIMLINIQDSYARSAYLETLLAEYGIKAAVEKTLMEDKLLPTFKDEIVKVNYEDGCKVYFEDGFVICRFSGTEPLLRIFAESTNPVRAKEYIETFKKFLFD